MLAPDDEALLGRVGGPPATDAPAAVSVLHLLDRDPEQGAKVLLRPDMHCRYTHMPIIPDWSHFDRLPQSQHAHRLISVTGKMVRTGPIKVRRAAKLWSCQRCKGSTAVPADDRLYGQCPKPAFCTQRSGDAAGQLCGNTKFDEDESDEVSFDDIQECRLQEPMAQLQMGAMPRSITVILLNKLVDSCHPGDDVQVIGVLESRWRPMKQDARCEGEFFLTPCNVTVKSSFSVGSSSVGQETFSSLQAGRGKALLLASFASEVYGLEDAKLAVLLTLIGGHTGRKEGHLLMVGDPGTAKSHLLKAASMVASRAVQVSGSGTSVAGLTAAAVKDSSDWHLEAGALVLADRGICCIDEFTAVKQADRAAIHEAMEQQRLSIAKAGLVCKLNTRCSILAACNPLRRGSGNWADVSSLTGIAGPLLSRFDLVLQMRDAEFVGEADWHRARHVIQRDFPASATPWDLKTCRSFVAHCRSLPVEMSDEARELLQAFYQGERLLPHRDPARTTVRLLESLIRLSEGHARLMGRQQALAEDAAVAIRLARLTLHGARQ